MNLDQSPLQAILESKKVEFVTVSAEDKWTVISHL